MYISTNKLSLIIVCGLFIIASLFSASSSFGLLTQTNATGSEQHQLVKQSNISQKLANGTITFLNVKVLGNSTLQPASIWFDFHVNGIKTRFPNTIKPMNLSKGEQISLPPNVSLPVYLSEQSGDEILLGPHNRLNLVVIGMDLNNIPSGCHGLSEAGKNPKLAYFYESCLKYNLSNKHPAITNTSYNLTPAMPISARTYNSTNNFGQGMHVETSTSVSSYL